MTLVELLYGICLISPPVGAVLEAHHLHQGPVGYALALLAGVALGAGFVWVLYKSETAMGRILPGFPGWPGAVLGFGFVGGALLWVGAAELAMIALVHVLFRLVY